MPLQALPGETSSIFTLATLGLTYGGGKASQVLFTSTACMCEDPVNCKEDVQGEGQLQYTDVQGEGQLQYTGVQGEGQLQYTDVESLQQAEARRAFAELQGTAAKQQSRRQPWASKMQIPRAPQTKGRILIRIKYDK